MDKGFVEPRLGRGDDDIAIKREIAPGADDWPLHRGNRRDVKRVECLGYASDALDVAAADGPPAKVPVSGRICFMLPRAENAEPSANKTSTRASLLSWARLTASTNSSMKAVSENAFRTSLGASTRLAIPSSMANLMC